MASPTQRTLKYLRDQGYKADVVEYWNSFARVRRDLFGIIDIVAVKIGCPGVLGVQATSYSNVSARIRKAKENTTLPVWIAAGNPFVIHGWRKGVKGEKALREVKLTSETYSQCLQENNPDGGEGCKTQIPNKDPEDWGHETT